MDCRVRVADCELTRSRPRTRLMRGCARDRRRSLTEWDSVDDDRGVSADALLDV